MDKEQTKELLLSLRLIIVGTFFWLLKPKFFLSFFLRCDSLCSILGLEIVGTILILIAILIIFFVFPFTYSLISCVYIIFVLVLDVLDFFLYRNPHYQLVQRYSLFFMALMLFFVAKLMQEGLRHFGSTGLSRKWADFSLWIFFGFCIPDYILVTLYNFGLLTLPSGKTLQDVTLMLSPVIIITAFCLLYYICFLVKSFQYLSSIQKKYNKKNQMRAED